MDPLEKFLRQIGPLIRASEAKQEPVPPDMVAALDAAILGKSQQPIILTEAQMRVEILRILEQPLDAYGLIQQLKEQNYSLAKEGFLFVYAILSKLEKSGLVVARRRVTDNQFITKYQVTGSGTKTLELVGNPRTSPFTQPSH